MNNLNNSPYFEFNNLNAQLKMMMKIQNLKIFHLPKIRQ